MSQETSNLNTETATVAQPEQTKNIPSQENVVDQATKAYTQEDVDNIMAKVKHTTESKVLKKFDGVDVNHYKNLLEKEELSKVEEQKKKGEFETILREQAEKANSKINNLTNELSNIKVDGALLNAASKHKAINPEQVTRLLQDQVRLSDTGQAEVVDATTGQARYNDKGEPLEISELVGDFMKANPHFASATPGGTDSRSNITSTKVTGLNLSEMDMSNPDHRKIYGEAKKLGKL